MKRCRPFVLFEIPHDRLALGIVRPLRPANNAGAGELRLRYGLRNSS